MYTVTFTVPNLDILHKIADAVKGGEYKAEKEEKPAKPKSEAVAAPAPKETPAAAPVRKELTPAERDLFEKVKDATTSLVKISHETAVAVLKQFSVKSASALKPEQYEEFLKNVNAVLENKRSESLI